MLTLLMAVAAQATTLTYIASDYTEPDDGEDDSIILQALLEEMEEHRRANPEIKVRLFFGKGVWELENRDNAKFGLRINAPVEILCEDPLLTVFRGDSTPGDHLGTDWTHKDLISIEAPAHDVQITNCGFEFRRPWNSKEQAHGISIYGEAGPVRGITLRNLRFSVIASGDAIYCGLNCEEVDVENVEVIDAARSGFVMGGAAKGMPNKIRRGIRIRDFRMWWTGFNPEQENGKVIDLEPAKNTGTRFQDVDISRVLSPQGSMCITHCENCTVDDVAVSWLQTSHLHRTHFSRILSDCRTGTGGDGKGYCVAHYGDPSIFTISNSTFRVNPEGAGFLYVLDSSGNSSLNPTERLQLVTIEDDVRVKLNGGLLLRESGTLSDPVNIDLNDVEIIDAPPLASIR